METQTDTRLAAGSISHAQADLLARRADIARTTVDRWMAGFPVRPKTIRRIGVALTALRAEGELP